jgi:hypothetical protein
MIKRNCFLALAFLCGFIQASAQKKVQGMIAELSVGPSFSIGKFGSKDFKNTSAGIANTGMAATLSIGREVTDKITAIFLAGYSMNKQDEKSMEGRVPQPVWLPGSTSKVETESWKIIRLMLGTEVHLPLSVSGKIFFTPKLLAGACKTAVPGYSGITYSSSGMFSGNFESKKIPMPWAFCYQIGTGLNVQLNKRIHLLADATYFNGRPTITADNVPFKGNRYSLSSLCVMAGAGLKL